MKLTLICPTLHLSSQKVEYFRNLCAAFDNVYVIISTAYSEPVESKDESGKITIISDQQNGVYAAINIAIEQVDSGWIQVIGDDDTPIISPELLNALSRSTAEIVFGNWLEGKVGGHLKIKKPQEPTLDSLTYKVTFNHQAMFVDRRLHTRIGLYDLKYEICADYDFICRAIFNKANFEIINVLAAKFHFGGISSRDQILNILERSLSIRRNFRYINLQRLFFKLLIQVWIEFAKKCVMLIKSL